MALHYGHDYIVLSIVFPINGSPPQPVKPVPEFDTREAVRAITRGAHGEYSLEQAGMRYIGTALLPAEIDAHLEIWRRLDGQLYGHEPRLPKTGALPACG